MPSERKPVECGHPSVFIREEMEARGWDRWTLARHMGGDYLMNRLVIELYFEVGPDKPNMRLDSTAEDFAQAFDVSAEFFRNLEIAWLTAQEKQGGIPPAGRGDG